MLKRTALFLATLALLSGCPGAQLKPGSQADLLRIEAECKAAIKAFCKDGDTEEACAVKAACAKEIDEWENAK